MIIVLIFHRNRILIIMTPHLNCLVEMVYMRGHNIILMMIIRDTFC